MYSYIHQREKEVVTEAGECRSSRSGLTIQSASVLCCRGAKQGSKWLPGMIQGVYRLCDTSRHERGRQIKVASRNASAAESLYKEVTAYLS